MNNNALNERLGNGLGDRNGLSWTCNYCGVVSAQKCTAEDREREILRELAKKVREISTKDIQEEKRGLWKAHNGLQETRPLIFCDPENAWYEIIKAADLKCTSPIARLFEFRLRKEIYWAEVICDDRVTEPCFTVQHAYRNTERGLETSFLKTNEKDAGALAWNAPLTDYSMLKDMRPSKIEVDIKKSRQIFDFAKEIFDGILEVRQEANFWWSFGLTSDAIYLIGFEKFLYDMYDEPEGLKNLMAFLRDEALDKLDYLNSSGLLTPNSLGDFVGTGGYGYSHELPEKFCSVTTKKMWGFCESQETVNVSPSFFEEFVFNYQLPILEHFGLNIYGCCEPLDTRLDIVLKTPRLRRVTVSPWSDKKYMAERLGKNYVYCSKINPAHMAQSRMLADAARDDLKQVFAAAKAHSCPCEVMLRDVVTLGGNPNNAKDWVLAAREEYEKLY